MPTDPTPTGQDPPRVRARRADRHRHPLRGAERGVPALGMRNHWGRMSRPGPGRAARARVVQRRRAAADDRGARRLPRSGAGCRPRHPSSGQRAGRGPGAVRRAPGARRAPGTVARLWHAATLLREHRGDGHDPRLGHRGEQVVARDLPHCVAEGAAAVDDDWPVEAVATADAALGRLEILHGDAGEHVVAVDLAVQQPCGKNLSRSQPRLRLSIEAATIGG